MVRGKPLFVGLAVLLCSLPFNATGAYPPDDEVKKELKALEGNWRLESATQDGIDLAQTPSNISFKKGKYTWHIGSAELDHSGKLILDPIKKVMELVSEKDDYAHEFKGKKRRLIYELNGDELKIAGMDPLYNPPTGKRAPKSFEEEGVYMYVYKR